MKNGRKIKPFDSKEFLELLVKFREENEKITNSEFSREFIPSPQQGLEGGQECLKEYFENKKDENSNKQI